MNVESRDGHPSRSILALTVGLLLFLFLIGCTATLPVGEASRTGQQGSPPTEVDSQVGSVEPSRTPAPPTPAETRTPMPPPSPTQTPDARAHNMVLVGSLNLRGGGGASGDIAAYGELAFVGAYCTGRGVHIIDISEPTQPEKLATTEGHRHTSMEDLEAVRLGERDVLVIGLQDCRPGEEAEPGKTGIELVDITDPDDPRSLAIFPTEGGVHELDITRAPDGRTLALLAIPGEMSLDEEATGEQGGLQIVDISDPRAPRLVSQWRLWDEPLLGPSVYRGAQRGAFPLTFLHSARANEDGTRAYLSYWDAGVILLDISSPEAPRYLGRTTFEEGAEGNAHSIAVAGDLLIQADEDFSATQLWLTSSAFEGRRTIRESHLSRVSVEQAPGGRVSGELVHIGHGCFSEDPAADPAGKIALAELGGCSMPEKIAVAQRAGAKGILFFGEEESDHHAGEEAMENEGKITLPDGAQISLIIPSLLIDEASGQELLAGSAPITVSIESLFDGMGFLRLFDISEPGHPVPLGTFATENSMATGVGPGIWTVHNPEVVGEILYASWYNDGVRAIDISDPSDPREIAFWQGAGTRAGTRVFIWGVVPHNGLLLASDIGSGLYILKHER